MKYYITLIFIALAVFSAETGKAQRVLKYKNVFEVVQTGNQEVAYPLLLNFQRGEPKHANTYYWLGEISL
ncbi:MAG TPA: hypothetical protein DCQ31_08035, partial [Bacteroidales bacterium]|nr:hypothetical protein [Bacteroidales bacterium]